MSLVALTRWLLCAMIVSHGLSVETFQKPWSRRKPAVSVRVSQYRFQKRTWFRRWFLSNVWGDDPFDPIWLRFFAVLKPRPWHSHVASIFFEIVLSACLLKRLQFCQVFFCVRHEKRGKSALHLKRLARMECPPLRKLKDFRVRRTFESKWWVGWSSNQQNCPVFLGRVLVNIFSHFWIRN